MLAGPALARPTWPVPLGQSHLPRVRRARSEVLRRARGEVRLRARMAGTGPSQQACAAVRRCAQEYSAGRHHAAPVQDNVIRGVGRDDSGGPDRRERVRPRVAAQVCMLPSCLGALMRESVGDAAQLPRLANPSNPPPPPQCGCDARVLVGVVDQRAVVPAPLIRRVDDFVGLCAKLTTGRSSIQRRARIGRGRRA